MQIIRVSVDVKNDIAGDADDDRVWTNAAMPASFGILVVLPCCATTILLAVALPAAFSR